MMIRVLAAALLLSIGPQGEPLTWKTYDAYRGRIDVHPDELAWQKIPWRNGFFEGLVEAQEKDRPIFYWIYEGDPRGGC